MANRPESKSAAASEGTKKKPASAGRKPAGSSHNGKKKAASSRSRKKKAAAASDSRKKKVRAVIIIVVVLVLVVAAIWIYRLLHQEDRPTLITEDNVEQVMEDKVEDGYYRVKMNNEWTFSGDTTEDAYIANVEQNTHPVYFDLTLPDEEDRLIYSSPYISVGDEMQGFTLDESVDPGTYDGVVTYHLVDTNHDDITTVSVSVTLTVN